MDKDQFRAWRKALGWSQEQAASALGLSRSSVIRYEQGLYEVPKVAELACRTLTAHAQFAEQREQ